MRITHGIGSLRRQASSVLVTLLILVTQAGSTRTASAASTVILGVGDGVDEVNATNQCLTDPLEEPALENWQQKDHAYIFVPMQWEHDLDAAFACLTYIWEVMHSIPSLAWRPEFPDLTGFNKALGTNFKQTVGCAQLIKMGRYNPYILAWSARMRAWLSGHNGLFGDGDDRRVFVSLLPEGNGTWKCYSPGLPVQIGKPDTIEDYKSAFQRVVKLVRGQTANGDLNPAPINDPKRLQWGWMSHAFGSHSLAGALYPGDEWVDWVGVDGYFHCYDTGAINSAFGDLLNWVAGHGKPLWVDQVGCDTETDTTTQAQLDAENNKKNVWISSFFNFIHSSAIRRIQWFNHDGAKDMQGDSDWAIFRRAIPGNPPGGDVTPGGISYRAYSAYRTGVQQSWIVGYTGVPRVLTDAQFLGQ